MLIRSIFWNTETQNLMQRIDRGTQCFCRRPSTGRIDASRESLLSLVQNRSYACEGRRRCGCCVGNCHIVDPDGVCLQQQIEAHCLYEKGIMV